MEAESNMTITNYMNLDKKIMILENKKVTKRKEFYQQSFSTSIAYTGYEIVVQAIRVESGVISLYELLDGIDRHIEIITFKQRFWLKFLHSLNESEEQYFYKRFRYGCCEVNEELDLKAMDEIEEIELAVSYRFGFRDEDTEKIELVPNDYMNNMDKILAALTN